MLIEIVGKPRSGKTALNTLFMLRELMTRGRVLQRSSAKYVTELNTERKNKLIIPDKPPVYANYEVEIPIGYKQTFKPYFLNPYRLGVPTAKTENKIDLMLPFSCLHITEGRKYWDGRESSSMPDNVSQFFETHGHNYMTIIIDAQRGKSLDLNIRENAGKFIEVQGMKNDKDAYGRVFRSVWYCREFYSLQDYEAYIAGKTAYYVETQYVYNGNIFKYYESRNRKEDYIPKEGKQYSTLQFVTAEELKKLPKEIKALYDTSRPSWYRQKAE